MDIPIATVEQLKEITPILEQDIKVNYEYHKNEKVKTVKSCYHKAKRNLDAVKHMIDCKTCRTGTIYRNKRYGRIYYLIKQQEALKACKPLLRDKLNKNVTGTIMSYLF